MHFRTRVSQSGDRCGDMDVIEVGGNTGAMIHSLVNNEFSCGAIHAITNSHFLSLSGLVRPSVDGSVRSG